jgi:hypothetical protein
MILAKRYDPDNPLIRSPMLNMGSDLDIGAAVFRTAFLRQGQSGSPLPVPKPGLTSPRAFTLTAGSSIYVVYIIRHNILQLKNFWLSASRLIFLSSGDNPGANVNLKPSDFINGAISIPFVLMIFKLL